MLKYITVYGKSKKKNMFDERGLLFNEGHERSRETDPYYVFGVEELNTKRVTILFRLFYKLKAVLDLSSQGSVELD